MKDRKGLSFRIGGFLFRRRDILPLPLFIALLVFSSPKLSTIILGLPFIMIGEAIRFWAVHYIGPS